MSKINSDNLQQPLALTLPHTPIQRVISPPISHSFQEFPVQVFYTQTGFFFLSPNTQANLYKVSPIGKFLMFCCILPTHLENEVVVPTFLRPLHSTVVQL